MKMPENGEKGFTLIELLIVVAIIGILAAIAIPQFGKYRVNSAIGSLQADMRSCLSEAVANYATGDESMDCEEILSSESQITGSAVIQFDGSGLPNLADGSFTVSEYAGVDFGDDDVTCTITGGRRVECSQ